MFVNIVPAYDSPLRRPRDANQFAKLMVDILTGEAEDRASSGREALGKALTHRHKVFEATSASKADKRLR